MKWVRTGCVVAVAMGTSALLHAALAQGQPSPFVGRWQLNLAQSKAAPGEAPPASLITQIERVDIAHVRWTTTTTDPQGQKDVETFDVPGNGEFYSLNGYAMVSQRLGGTTLQSTFRDDQSGQTDVLTCTLSPDARQMTCHGAVTPQGGAAVSYTDVFDRV